jgi:hypothetical protein
MLLGLGFAISIQVVNREGVAFTHMENLPARSDKTIKFMAWTPMRQRSSSPVRGSAMGRKLTKPVYCHSLSWVRAGRSRPGRR